MPGMTRGEALFTRPEDRNLWAKACRKRERYWGRDVHLRGIVEFSNHCRQNCLYCGLRRENTSRIRYRMSPKVVLACAATVKQLGFGTVVLQAGEDPGFPARDIALIVRRIKKDLDLAVTLSLGEWDESVFALWREAGADRYLLKLETADKRAYARFRPGRTLEQRLDALGILAGLGYETGTGLITGLPGDTPDLLGQGLALIARLRPDMVSLSPFTPHPATPLGRYPACEVEDNLRALAQARVRIPEAHIPVTSALGLHGDAVRLAALEVGNVLMPSLTPESVRGAYDIYPGKNRQALSPRERAAAFVPLLKDAGFALPRGPGRAWRLTGGSGP